MRLLSGLLISTFALGAIVTTGCAEHRYGGDPYYGNGGYYGDYYAANDPYYRQWLAERRYDYVEYNRLSRDRQQEYWQWRRQNEARFREDPRSRGNQGYASNGRYANDRDRDDRRNSNYARTRNGDGDRHQRDRDRREVRKDRDKDRDKDHDHDRR